MIRKRAFVQPDTSSASHFRFDFGFFILSWVYFSLYVFFFVCAFVLFDASYSLIYVVINCWWFLKLYFMISLTHSLFFSSFLWLLLLLPWCALISSFAFFDSQKVLICANFWWFRSPHCACSFSNIGRYCGGQMCICFGFFSSFSLPLSRSPQNAFSTLCVWTNDGDSVEFKWI